VRQGRCTRKYLCVGDEAFLEIRRCQRRKFLLVFNNFGLIIVCRIISASFYTPGSCFSKKTVNIRMLRDDQTITIEDETNSRKKTQMLLSDIDSVIQTSSGSILITYSYGGGKVPGLCSLFPPIFLWNSIIMCVCSVRKS
jgi:hypothetical protein